MKEIRSDVQIIYGSFADDSNVSSIPADYPNETQVEVLTETATDISAGPQSIHHGLLHKISEIFSM